MDEDRDEVQHERAQQLLGPMSGIIREVTGGKHGLPRLHRTTVELVDGSLFEFGHHPREGATSRLTLNDLRPRKRAWPGVVCSTARSAVHPTLPGRSTPDEPLSGRSEPLRGPDCAGSPLFSGRLFSGRRLPGRGDNGAPQTGSLTSRSGKPGSPVPPVRPCRTRCPPRPAARDGSLRRCRHGRRRRHPRRPSARPRTRSWYDGRRPRVPRATLMSR